LHRLMLSGHPGRMSAARDTAPEAIAVALLEPADSGDAALVDRLTRLVNDVYAIAEIGLWRDEAARTTATELAGMIWARQIAVATRQGRVVGSVRVHQISDHASEFGLLVAAPDERRTGVGRALIDFAESHSRERGLRAIQLELLVPRGWAHPSKEFLRAWYGRRGYRIVATRSINDAYPHLAPLLATACDLEVHEKQL
jgi:GNAT superfamily N-acetyltransferase